MGNDFVFKRLNKSKAKAINSLLIKEVFVLLAFLACFYFLNVGFVDGIIGFYNGFIVCFTLSSYNSLYGIIANIVTLGISALTIVLIFVSCFKRNDRKLKTYAIVLSVFMAVFAIIAAIVNYLLTNIETVFNDAFNRLAYGDQWLTIVFMFYLAFALFVFAFVLYLVIIILALSGWKPADKGDQSFEEEVKRIIKDTVPCMNGTCSCSEKKGEAVKEELTAEPIKEEPIKEIEPIKEEPAEEEPIREEAAVTKKAPEKESEPEKEETEDKEESDIDKLKGLKRNKTVPFVTKLKYASPDTIANYNDIKAEMESYGVKSRISVAGDTFRLHKVEYLKITLVGKTLKLYYRLTPKDYDNSPIHIYDVSDKKLYAEIPALFKVRSDLSVRRAKSLIKDTMDKAGIAKKEIK